MVAEDLSATASPFVPLIPIVREDISALNYWQVASQPIAANVSDSAPPSKTHSFRDAQRANLRHGIPPPAMSLS
jgi:hypothetical protein